MEQVLGVKKGAVTILSIVNDHENKVHLILDQRLANDFEYVAFHPMQNDATTAIKKEDLHKIIQLSKHQAEVLDFSKLVEEETKAAKPEEKKGGKG